MTKDKLPSLCIIADVMGSRSDDKKQELRQIVDMINDHYGTKCLTRFVIRNGDELFGILRYLSDGYGVIKLLFEQSELIKIPLYVGIGIGYVNQEDLHNPHEVNGTAVWSAADALHAVKSNRTGAGRQITVRRTFKFDIQSTEELEIPTESLNYMLFFLFERMQKRTEKQREIIRTLEATPEEMVHYDWIGEQVGYDSNKSVNVSKMLQRADYHLIAGAEQSLITLLEYIQNQIKKRGPEGA